MKTALRVFAILCLLIAAGVWVATRTPSSPFDGRPASAEISIEKGAYAARLADCVACHTAEGGAPFAGGLAMVILRGGEVIQVNERFATLCGRKPAELVGRQRRELFAEAPERRSANELGAGEGASEGELLHADGGYVPVERLCRTIEYRGRQCDVIFVRDLTARKDAERTIEHLAHHDALTDLSNRSSFDRRLRQALAAAVHHNDALAVLCLDLDRFKAVNDIFGHDVDHHLSQAKRD